MPRNRAHVLPAPPETLSATARGRWETVTPLLQTRGPIDVVLLATYCETWARWQDAEQAIRKAGTLVRSARGNVTASPLLSVSRQALQQAHDLERQLGLEPREPPREERAPSDVLTRRALAAALGVHMMTVTKWEREGLPVARRGARGRASHYREADVRAWLQQRDVAARKGTGVDVAADRARKERAQAIESEQRVAMKARDLLARDEVERLWTAEVIAVRTRLLALPAAAADTVHRAALLEGVGGVESALQELIHEVLRELADPDRAPLAATGTEGPAYGR